MINVLAAAKLMAYDGYRKPFMADPVSFLCGVCVAILEIKEAAREMAVPFRDASKDSGCFADGFDFVYLLPYGQKHLIAA